jgi:hypothetical protein
MTYFEKSITLSQAFVMAQRVFYFFVYSGCRHLQGKQLFCAMQKLKSKYKNDNFHNFMINKIPKVYQI